MPNVNGTQYKILSDGVLDKLKSSGIPNITEEELDELILSHLRSACVKFKCCTQNLFDRNEVEKCFNFELTDEEIEILICLLTIEYISANYINVPSLLRQNLTSKDFKVFSSSEHLLRLTGLRDTYKKEAHQMMSIYSFANSSVF